MYALSYVKLLITIVKYVPQAWLNYKRKSTDGWSCCFSAKKFGGHSINLTSFNPTTKEPSSSGDQCTLLGGPGL